MPPIRTVTSTWVLRTAMIMEVMFGAAGALDGDAVGAALLITEGTGVGLEVGMAVGATVGDTVGDKVGSPGLGVGRNVGL